MSEWDYIIVGSGAGGGTLAARLVESGMRVCVLEAGGDARRTEAERLPDDYEVPGFHAFACENPAMSWDFQVRHYDEETQQLRDPKYNAGRGGVSYPRGATLGGSTAHNAMIFMLPHESDWDGIAQLTGDDSWRASRMRQYVQRLEGCDYQPLWRALKRFGLDPSGHGWTGWLPTEAPKVLEALRDEVMDRFLLDSTRAFLKTLGHPLKRILHWLRGAGDPNFRGPGGRSFEGLCYTPLATSGHQRVGARERLRQAQAANPDRLHIELNALVTRVLFDADGKTARGVEYLKGEHLYVAAGRGWSGHGVRHELRARREVVLCGGTFNTPQLLMLSGIGPAAQLQAHGIGVRVNLPGVGNNVQDRYEVAVTHRMREPWALRKGARFKRGDPVWQRWQTLREGLYASNGAALSFIYKSSPEVAEPDVFGMALPARFEGYFPGFSQWIRDEPDRLTWSLLKAHTHNRAGSVRLQSADPRRPPRIDFRYFEEGSPGADQDIQALVGAIRRVRQLTQPLIEARWADEVAPGPGVTDDVGLAEYVRNNAWGHHACGSCAIGPEKDGGVIDSNFAVHGTQGLRVVDAAVFPRIPGFFLVSAVYLIAEKAADVIQAAARAAPQPQIVKGATYTSHGQGREAAPRIDSEQAKPA